MLSWATEIRSDPRARIASTRDRFRHRHRLRVVLMALAPGSTAGSTAVHNADDASSALVGELLAPGVHLRTFSVKGEATLSARAVELAPGKPTIRLASSRLADALGGQIELGVSGGVHARRPRDPDDRQPALRGPRRDRERRRSRIEANARWIVELDRAKAIALAVARPGDVVVIAGKGHELVQEARGAETAFSDVEVARRAV